MLVSASAVANPMAVNCLAFSLDRFGLMKNGPTRLAISIINGIMTARKYALWDAGHRLPTQSHEWPIEMLLRRRPRDRQRAQSRPFCAHGKCLMNWTQPAQGYGSYWPIPSSPNSRWLTRATGFAVGLVSTRSSPGL